MPLQKNNVVFPMVKGIDTKSDQKQLVTGQMEVLENAQLISPNQFKKRNGYEKIAEVENPRAVTSYKDGAVVYADNTVYSYSPAAEGVVQIKADEAQTTFSDYNFCQIQTYNGIINDDNFTTTDSAYHSSGVQAFVSSSPDHSYFSIIDYETKNTLYGPVRFLANTFSKTKVFVIGNLFIILYYNSTSIRYIAVPVNTRSGVIPNSVQISNTFNTAASFDGCVLNDVLYIVWGTVAPGIGIASLTSFLTLNTSALPVADIMGIPLNVAPDATTGLLNIAYWNATSVKYMQATTMLTIQTVPVVVEVLANVKHVALIINNNAGYIYYEYADPTVPTPPTDCFYNNIIKRCTVTAAVPAAGDIWIRSVAIVSKPFKAMSDGSEVVCIFVGYVGNQPVAGFGTVFLLNENAFVITKLAPGNSSYRSSSSVEPAWPKEVDEVSSGVYTSSFRRSVFLASADDTLYANYGAFGVEIDFTEIERNGLSEEAAWNLHTVGGTLQMYDGANFVEHSFHIISEAVVTGTPTYDGALNNFPTGDYTYVMVYEWFDNAGNIHLGVPSTAVTISVTGPQTVIPVYLPCLKLTQKNNIFLSLFRNTLAAPNTYYRVGSVPTSAQANNTQSNYTLYNDSSPDSVIETHQQIYTTGGVVPNYSVPAPRVIFGFKNRLVVVPSEDPNIMWISKEILQGIPGVPVEFSAFMTSQVNTLYGPITAGIQMDEKGILFKRSAIFYFTGDGPNNTLTFDDISEPIQVPTDVGCTNAASVVLTPFGVMFKSEKGIYLLDRSLNVTYIGAPVEAYNDAEIVSAELISVTQQVRFLLDTGIALVFDYLAQQWFIYTNHTGVSATLYNDNYLYLRDNGELYLETPGEYSDNGIFIRMRLKTGWLSFTGIQGFQRVYKMLMLGEYKSSHQLLISVAYDFDPNTFQTIQFNPGELYDNPLYGESTPYGEEEMYGGDYPLEQFTIWPIRQKCESIQFTIEDVQNGFEIGESYAISSLGFEVGVEGGLQRQRAANKFG